MAALKSTQRCGVGTGAKRLFSLSVKDQKSQAQGITIILFPSRNVNIEEKFRHLLVMNSTSNGIRARFFLPCCRNLHIYFSFNQINCHRITVMTASLKENEKRLSRTFAQSKSGEEQPRLKMLVY